MSSPAASEVECVAPQSDITLAALGNYQDAFQCLNGFRLATAPPVCN